MTILFHMFYKPHYFQIHELVDKKTYLKFGDDALMFFNPIALQMLDGLRDFLGVPLIVNNWRQDGPYEFSGFRPSWCQVGAEYSQHRLGNAFDIKLQFTGKLINPVRISIENAFIKIINGQADERLKYLNCMEDIQFTPSWLHIDCRNIPDRIRIVKP